MEPVVMAIQTETVEQLEERKKSIMSDIQRVSANTSDDDEYAFNELDGLWYCISIIDTEIAKRLLANTVKR